MYETNDCERFADAKVVSETYEDIAYDEYEVTTVMDCGCIIRDNYETTPGYRCHYTWYNCDNCKVHMTPKITEHKTRLAPIVE